MGTLFTALRVDRGEGGKEGGEGYERRSEGRGVEEGEEGAADGVAGGVDRNWESPTGFWVKLRGCLIG